MQLLFDSETVSNVNRMSVVELSESNSHKLIANGVDENVDTQVLTSSTNNDKEMNRESDIELGNKVNTLSETKKCNGGIDMNSEDIGNDSSENQNSTEEVRKVNGNVEHDSNENETSALQNDTTNGDSCQEPIKEELNDSALSNTENTGISEIESNKSINIENVIENSDNTRLADVVLSAVKTEPISDKLEAIIEHNIEILTNASEQCDIASDKVDINAINSEPTSDVNSNINEQTIPVNQEASPELQVHVKLETHSEQDAPIEPVTPSEPDAPIEPVTPSEPDAPIEPVTPSEPDAPIEAVTPSEPDAPIEAVTHFESEATVKNEPIENAKTSDSDNQLQTNDELQTTPEITTVENIKQECPTELVQKDAATETIDSTADIEQILETLNVKQENASVLSIIDNNIVEQLSQIVEEELNDMDVDTVENKDCVKVESLDVSEPVITTPADIDSENSKQVTEDAIKKETSTSVNNSNKSLQTLDILSDSDEDPQNANISSTSEKQCIDLEEDDDVMLIDDIVSSKDATKGDTLPDISKPDAGNKADDSMDVDIASNDTSEKESTKSDKIQDAVSDKPQSPVPQINDKGVLEKVAKTVCDKPLVPVDFLELCKPTLSEMTRDNLEEFCLRILMDGIMDKSNLSEYKTKLKSMMQNNEEWRKKVMVLKKQTRDLQIVLNTVQEEQKKRKTDAIVPLRITRSVGMQVFMAEKKNDHSTLRARRQVSVAANKSKTVLLTKSAPKLANPIPVPRLVPAPSSPAKSLTKTPPPQVQNATVSSNTGKQNTPPASTPPPQKDTSPQQRAEKRPLSSIQSMTVDLTDDEPPAKQQATRSPVGALRVVPQQQLVASPRSSVVSQPVNTPRKVYIPISGPQTQNIRPGQTIMFKTVAQPNSIRPRNPNALNMRLAGATPIRLATGVRPTTNRHPAPLPEAPKQQQPPNWKHLPPAPDLKISKVENGIVISWKIDGYQENDYEEIASYQLYAYQETSSPPSTILWKKIGDVKALPLPMACTLTQFMSGYKYYFAVRAVDVRSRIGSFSLPGSILLLSK